MCPCTQPALSTIAFEREATTPAESSGRPRTAVRRRGPAATAFRVLWRLFLSAVHQPAPREAVGKAWQGVVAALLGAVGALPSANTAWTHVSALGRLAIPLALQLVIAAARPQ
jgi:hypothetical protein